MGGICPTRAERLFTVQQRQRPSFAHVEGPGKRHHEHVVDWRACSAEGLRVGVQVADHVVVIILCALANRMFCAGQARFRPLADIERRVEHAHQVLCAGSAEQLKGERGRGHLKLTFIGV